MERDTKFYLLYFEKKKFRYLFSHPHLWNAIRNL